MDKLNKELTLTEKILLVILGLVIIGAIYYLFVFTPIEDGIRSAISEQQALQSELAITETRLKKIEKITGEMNGENSSLASYMPSYNSGKDEVDFLHKLLGSAKDYSISFTDLTREGDLIRRHFLMSFTASSFSKAEDIITELENSEIRCLVGDVSVSPVFRESNLQDGEVVVNLGGTFYETMHDGKADKELPEDTANK